MPLSSRPWVDWRTFWSCMPNLIVLYILFLRANFSSNTRWENQPFHHNENSFGLYSQGFSKSLEWELTIFPGFFQTKLHYEQLHITLQYTILCPYLTSRKKNGGCHRQCGNVLTFSEGGIAGVSSHNLKNRCKYFV